MRKANRQRVNMRRSPRHSNDVQVQCQLLTTAMWKYFGGSNFCKVRISQLTLRVEPVFRRAAKSVCRDHSLWAYATPPGLAIVLTLRR